MSVSEFEEILGAPLSAKLRSYWNIEDFRYSDLTHEERDHYILEVVNTLCTERLSAAGDARQPEWERGWGQNLEAFKKTGNPESLVPRYHGKHQLLHWRQRIIRPITPHLDYAIICMLVDWAIETFLLNTDMLMEFGCGPAYHLLRARRYNREARLVGLDWATASQEIIAAIVATGIETRIEGHRFNFYEPDEGLQFVPNTGILTVAALEQVGDRIEPFLQYLLRKRPAICVHLEPIDELMDSNNLIDSLSVLYCRKRNYLKGFLPRLRQLQDEGKVKILREQRTYTGSFFIEGHSLVVWKPL